MFKSMLKVLLELTTQKVEDNLACEQTYEWAQEMVDYCTASVDTIRDMVSNIEVNDEETYNLIKSSHNVVDQVFRLKDKAQLFIRKYQDEQMRLKMEREHIEWLRKKADAIEARSVERQLKNLEEQICKQEQLEREVETKANNIEKDIFNIFERFNSTQTFSTKDILNVYNNLIKLPYDYQKDIKNVNHFFDLVSVTNDLIDICKKVNTEERESVEETILQDFADNGRQHDNYYEVMRDLSSHVQEVLINHSTHKQINVDEILHLKEDIDALPDEFKIQIPRLDEFNKLALMAEQLNKLRF